MSGKKLAPPGRRVQPRRPRGEGPGCGGQRQAPGGDGSRGGRGGAWAAGRGRRRAGVGVLFCAAARVRGVVGRRLVGDRVAGRAAGVDGDRGCREGVGVGWSGGDRLVVGSAALEAAGARATRRIGQASGEFRHAPDSSDQPVADAEASQPSRSEAAAPDDVPAVGDAEDAPPGVQGVGVRASGSSDPCAEARDRRGLREVGRAGAAAVGRGGRDRRACARSRAAACSSRGRGPGPGRGAGVKRCARGCDSPSTPWAATTPPTPS